MLTIFFPFFSQERKTRKRKRNAYLNSCHTLFLFRPNIVGGTATRKWSPVELFLLFGSIDMICPMRQSSFLVGKIERSCRIFSMLAFSAPRQNNGLSRGMIELASSSSSLILRYQWYLISLHLKVLYHLKVDVKYWKRSLRENEAVGIERRRRE